MRVIFTLIALITFGPLWSQSQDYYVKTIENLRSNGKLTKTASVNKTIEGSVTAYYHKGSLVLINSLADAEAAGRETLYFTKNGVLIKALIMSASFGDNEWSGYYSKHLSRDRCYACHGELNCIVTEITFGDKPTVVTTENKKKRELSQGEKDKMIAESQKTFELLKDLSKDLD